MAPIRDIYTLNGYGDQGRGCSGLAPIGGLTVSNGVGIIIQVEGIGFKACSALTHIFSFSKMREAFKETSF